MPLGQGNTPEARGKTYRMLKAEHPDWSHKQIVAVMLSQARRTRKPGQPKVPPEPES